MSSLPAGDGLGVEGRPWFVVRTQSRREERAAVELRNQGFTVFLPRYQKQVRHARRVTTTVNALFPGYIFVEGGIVQRWRSINGTIGVIGLVMMGGMPASVPSNVVASLEALCDGNGYITLAARSAFGQGERVRITGGSFADMLGLFEGVRDRDRVMILLYLLGRKVVVDVEGWLVEKAA